MTSKTIEQGAEAKIILTRPQGKNNSSFIIKDRIKKNYRVKELDDKLRFRRTRSEAKLLAKASEVIDSPKPFFEPSIENSSKLKMPFIKGKKLSEFLKSFPTVKQKQICRIVGTNIAKLHDADIIHGDLTTSNMILVEGSDKKINDRKSVNVNSHIVKSVTNHKLMVQDNNSLRKRGDNFKVFFIDFGLGYISNRIEDRAVDLHLLRQALEAKHFEHWKVLFDFVLKGYSSSKNATKVLQQFKKVEARGRYKENY